MSDHTQTTTMTNVQSILTAAWRTPVKLAVADELNNDERSATRRLFIADGPANAPKSVIVKQVFGDDDEPFSPDDGDSFAVQRFFNEWAGLQLLGDIFDDEPPVPQLYGADRTTGILVLEDLGQENTLVDIVQGDEPALAKEGLVELMATLGRIHASTIGREESYLRIRQAIVAPPILPYFSSAAEAHLQPAEIAKICHNMLDTIGIPTITGIDQDLAAVTQFWAEPGPFKAYLHGDPAPGNEFKVGNQRKMIDFEYGCFGHALAEGATARIQFVTGHYVQRIPHDVALAMENAYRAELVNGCPEAGDDDIFYPAITEACAYATIGMWNWAMPDLLTEDSDWGLSSCRQRVLRRLEILAETTATFGHLEALGEVAIKIREELCRRWPMEVHTMPYYPAFR